MRFSLSKTPLFRSKKWLIMHTVNRDHEPPFWTCLQLNPNSDRKIRQHGRKKRSMKSLDPYLSFHSSNWITKLVHTEKTRKENLFIPRATIPSKSTCKKMHAPDWLITSTIMQFGACPTSSGYSLNMAVFEDITTPHPELRVVKLITRPLLYRFIKLDLVTEG